MIYWVKEQISLLPYQMTLEQQEAVNDCFRDFPHHRSMYPINSRRCWYFGKKTFVHFIAHWVRYHRYQVPF